MLFKLNISWTSRSGYRFDVCTPAPSGKLRDPCNRTSFGQLLERNLWPLVVQPLQDALCDVGLEQFVPTSMVGLGLCDGTLSTVGDRLRLAGVQGTATEVPPDGFDEGSLLLFLDAVPARAGRAEELRDDLAAFLASVKGLAVGAADVTAYSAAEPSIGSGFGAAKWLLRGLGRLKTHPRSFRVRDDGGLDSFDWFPTFELSGTEPYVINRRIVPQWRLLDVGPRSPDANREMLSQLHAAQDSAVCSLSVVLASALALALLVRFVLWPVLFGAKRRWTTLHTLRTVSALALLMGLLELGTAVFTVFLCRRLANAGTLDHLAPLDVRRPMLTLTFVPVLVCIVLPSLSLSWGALRPPRCKCRCVGCWHIRRWQLQWLFVVAVGWHALAGLVLAVLARWHSAGSLDGPLAYWSVAVASCKAELAAACSGGEVRQLDSFSSEHRAFCDQDCERVLTPSSDVLTALESLVCAVGFCLGLWSFCLNVLQLVVVFSARGQLFQASVADLGKISEAAVPESGFAAKLEARGDFAGPLPPGEDVLTPDVFAAGIRAAEERRRLEAEERQARERRQAAELERDQEQQRDFNDRRRSRSSLPAPLLLPTPPPQPLSATGDEAMQRVLAALAAVEGEAYIAPDAAGRVPGEAAAARTETAADGDLAELFASAARRISKTSGGGGALSSIAAEDDKELLGFAQMVARSVSRDTYLSRDTVAAASRAEPHSEGSASARSDHSAASSASGRRRKRAGNEEAVGEKVSARSADRSGGSGGRREGSEAWRHRRGNDSGEEGDRPTSARSAVSSGSGTSGKPRFVADW